MNFESRLKSFGDFYHPFHSNREFAEACFSLKGTDFVECVFCKSDIFLKNDKIYDLWTFHETECISNYIKSDEYVDDLYRYCKILMLCSKSMTITGFAIIYESDIRFLNIEMVINFLKDCYETKFTKIKCDSFDPYNLSQSIENEYDFIEKMFKDPEHEKPFKSSLKEMLLRQRIDDYGIHYRQASKKTITAHSLIRISEMNLAKIIVESKFGILSDILSLIKMRFDYIRLDLLFKDDFLKYLSQHMDSAEGLSLQSILFFIGN